MAQRPASIHDVAQRAGVSAATVSHVLNASRFVSDETRARVLSAAHDLGYIPSAIARGLRNRRTRTIGLIVSDVENPYFTEVARAVERRAADAGYTVVLGNTDEDPAREQAIVRVMLSQRVDGIVLAPAAGDRDLEHLRTAQDRQVPVILVNRRLDGIVATTVTADAAAGSYALTRHVIAQGHRRIAAVRGRLDTSTTQDRLAGYRRALEEAGVDDDPALVVMGGSKTDAAYAVTAHVLRGAPLPTCIYAFNNLMTEGVLLALKDLGVACPEEMSLVGFDDFRSARAVTPPLTVVAQPTHEIGRVATELLLRRLEGEGVEDVVLPTRLAVRGSCVPPQGAVQFRARPDAARGPMASDDALDVGTIQQGGRHDTVRVAPVP